jgi:hypothetical protein
MNLAGRTHLKTLTNSESYAPEIRRAQMYAATSGGSLAAAVTFVGSNMSSKGVAALTNAIETDVIPRPRAAHKDGTPRASPAP